MSDEPTGDRTMAGNRRLTIAFTVFLIVWVGVMTVQAQEWNRLADRAFPTGAGVFILTILVVKLLEFHSPEIFKRLRTTDSIQFEEPTPPSAEAKSKSVILAWVILLPIAMIVIGFSVAVPLYTFAISYYYNDDRRYATMLAVVVLAFLYVLFIQILNIQIWNGMLGIPNLLRLLF